MRSAIAQTRVAAHGALIRRSGIPAAPVFAAQGSRGAERLLGASARAAAAAPAHDRAQIATPPAAPPWLGPPASSGPRMPASASAGDACSRLPARQVAPVAHFGPAPHLAPEVHLPSAVHLAPAARLAPALQARQMRPRQAGSVPPPPPTFRSCPK